jgi:hypothetical protein
MTMKCSEAVDMYTTLHTLPVLARHPLATMVTSSLLGDAFNGVVHPVEPHLTRLSCGTLEMLRLMRPVGLERIDNIWLIDTCHFLLCWSNVGLGSEAAQNGN